MSSVMCSYLMLILLQSRMLVFCVFLFVHYLYARSFLLHANSNSLFASVSKDKVQRVTNLSIHAIARFLVVLLGRFTVCFSY